MVVAFVPPRDRLRGVPQPRAARPVHRPRARCRTSPSQLPLLDDPRRPLPDGLAASAASRRSRRPCATPACSGRCSCSRRRWSSPTSARDHGGGPVFDPVVKFVNRYRARPTAPGGADLHELRDVRAADHPEPLDGPGVPRGGHDGELRRGARRPQLGELARPAARRACPGCSPAPRSSCTSKRHSPTEEVDREGHRALVLRPDAAARSPWPAGATTACPCCSSRPPAVTPRRSSATSSSGTSRR